MRPDELPRNYYASRLDDRLVSELLGLCKGVIADGTINEDEAIAMRVWAENHPDAIAGFPGRELYERLERVFADGIVDVDERIELEEMVRDLVGEKPDNSGNMNNSTRLPLDVPPPSILFEGREFAFSGNFCMPRRECEKMVSDRAGRVSIGVRRSTNYLVVGTVASDAWVTANWGNKILKAMDLKAEGLPLAIVAESHWLEAIEFGA